MTGLWLGLFSSAAFKCEVIPYLVLVDTAGVVRYTHVGYDPSLTQRLGKLIEQYRKH